jgi:hypothetical protein
LELDEWFMGYLAEREAWERRAHADYEAALVEGRGANALEAIERAYAELAATYFDLQQPREGALTFGDPPGVSAHTTRAVSVHEANDGTAVIETLESMQGHRTLVRYRLRLVDGRWRIVNRQAQLDGRRWVHLLP